MNECITHAIDLCGGQVAAARAVGVSASTPAMWKKRGAVPAEHCAAIETASGGRVMRWQLRPNDWWRIWPELIDRPDAPPVPAEEAA